MIRRLIITGLLLINSSTLAISSPIFSSDCFSHHINDWNKYKSFFEGKNNIKCLEVGSYEGRSTIYIAENYCKYKDSDENAMLLELQNNDIII